MLSFILKNIYKNVLKIYHIFLFSLLLTTEIINATNIQYSTNIQLQINGLSGKLEQDVLRQLSFTQNDEVNLDKGLYLRIDNTIRRTLKVFGYYEPTINLNLLSNIKKRNQIIDIFVDPGKQVHIGDINVILRGDACTNQDYLNLLNNLPIVGSSLNHEDYDNFKKLLTDTALSKGFFDSKFNKNQLGIALDRHQAFWNIDYDSGQRYCFGTVNFEGSQIRDEYLRNLIPFKEGEYFESKKLAELNQYLSSTGWFNSIFITQRIDKSRKKKTLILNGLVSPQVKNIIETGIGYSTEIGPRIKLSWKKPWTNSCGCSLSTNSSISLLKQQLDFVYKIPLIKKPLEHFYLIEGNFKSTKLNDTKVNSTNFAIARHWDLLNHWQKIIIIRFSFDNSVQTNFNKRTILLYPGIIINYSHSSGGLMPTSGISQRYSIDYSNNTLGSDINFIAAQAQNIWIHTMYNYYRFITRSNIGWIKSNNLNKVPLHLHFFTNDDRSNYRYKSIIPININDESSVLTGLSKIITGSVELQYNIVGDWWGTIFVDSGEVVRNIQHSKFKNSLGIGLQWKSIIGPIKFDLFLPFNNKIEHGLQFYISLGPEL